MNACKSKIKYLDASQLLKNQNNLVIAPLAPSVFNSSLTNIKEKKSLAILLPYDPSSKIKNGLIKGLEEYRMLLNVLQAAILEYNAGNLEKFDPLVGENACQIRAVKMAILSAKNLIDFSQIESQVKEKSKIIELLLSQKNINLLMQTKMTLKEILERESLIIQLTSDELFVLKSFILTESKISQSSDKIFYIQKKLFCKTAHLYLNEDSYFKLSKIEKIHPKILKRYGDVSSKFTEKIVRRTRKLLSKESIDFLKEIIINNNDKSLKNMLLQRFTTRHLNYYCLPMFWSYKTIFLILQKEKIPIIIHAKFIDKKNNDFKVIDEEYLIYENHNDLNIYTYSAKSNNLSNLNSSAIVIQGIVYQNYDKNFKNNWKKLMIKSSIKNMILAGAADHRQYPNPEYDYLINELKNEEYEYYKTLANEKGFSLINPSTFFIQHVYASSSLVLK
ncbi:MAG: hypothetical protein KR126chlam4_01058 [Candidatus Anoxychlamydiales bacterium]|nr:hypothetical protein [Candidatus Anoxychlamydiales bacterium]